MVRACLTDAGGAGDGVARADAGPLGAMVICTGDGTVKLADGEAGVELCPDCTVVSALAVLPAPDVALFAAECAVMRYDTVAGDAVSREAARAVARGPPLGA